MKSEFSSYDNNIWAVEFSENISSYFFIVPNLQLTLLFYYFMLGFYADVYLFVCVCTTVQNADRYSRKTLSFECLICVAAYI